jgi:hypothetical protein
MHQNDVTASSYIFSICISFQLYPTSDKPWKQLSYHLRQTLRQNIAMQHNLSAGGYLLLGGTTKIGNRMEITPIIISVYISKMMPRTLIMTAITIKIAIIH